MTHPFDLKQEGLHLMLGDCLDRMAEIPDGSVDMILCDPPYGTVKGLKMYDYAGGHAVGWDTPVDHEGMTAQAERVLRVNGAKVLFSQEPYTSVLTTGARPAVPFSYRMVWDKVHFANALSAKKAPVKRTEDICCFFKKHTKHDFEGGHPLRPYAAKICEFIGVPTKGRAGVFREMGHERLCHFTRHATSQFSLCTLDTYLQLDGLYGISRAPGYLPFDVLAAVDRKYRRELTARMAAASPKVFNLLGGAKHASDLLQFKKDRTGHHPTQKPVALMEYLVKTYTNEGDTVLDFTMGSGTTGVACKNTGRKFIGIELDPLYYAAAAGRILEL